MTQTVSQRFRLVLFTVVTFALLALGAAVWIALVVDDPNPQVKKILLTLDWTYKLGFGAIAGLMSGKSL